MTLHDDTDAALAAERRNCDQQIADLQAQLDAALAENTADDATITQLQAQIADLQAQLDELRGTPTMLVGANEGRIPELEAALAGPKLQVRRSYDGTVDDVIASVNADKAAGRLMSMPSFTSWPTASTLARLMDSITLPTLLTYLHEIDNGPKLDPPTYKARMNAAYDAAEASGNPNVKVGPLLTADPWRTNNSVGVRNAIQYMPDRMHVNMVDFYRYARDPGDTPDPTLGFPPLRSPGWLLGEEKDDGSPKPGGGIVTWSQQRGVPIAVGEFNAHPYRSNLQNRPQWYRDAFAYLRAIPSVGGQPGCLAACIFHSPFGAHGPWLVHKFPVYTTDERDPARLGGDPDPDSLAAFKAELIAAS